MNPPNILLAEDGRVLLSDFGIAKARQRQTHTTAGAVKGKLDYLSPEQVTGMEIDRRADLFSLGAVLYLLLTGVQPFRASGPALTLMRIRDAQVAPPSILDRRLPPAFDAIVAKALARDRNARYADGAAFERDLRAVLQTLGPVTRQEMQAFVAEEWPARAPDAENGKLEAEAGEEEELADFRDDDEGPGPRGADELSALVPADSIGLGEAHAPSAGISLPSSDGSDPIVEREASGAGSVSGSISISIATERTAISRRPEATIVSSREETVAPDGNAPPERTTLMEPTVAPEEPPALENTAPRARSAPPAEDTSPTAWRIPEKRRSAAAPVPQESVDLAPTKSSSMPPPEAQPEPAPVLRDGATRTAPPRGARDAPDFPWTAPPRTRRAPITALVVVLGVAALGAWRLRSTPAPPPAPTPVLAEETNEAAAATATPSGGGTARTPKVAHTAAPRAVASATNPAAATPRPTATRVAVSAPRTGTLSIWIDGGWAKVTIDGKPAATAPVVGLELPEGPHKIVLENPGTGFLHEYDLRITAGRESKLTARLGAPDPPPTSPAAP